MRRVRLKRKVSRAGIYFFNSQGTVPFVSSGCTLLDCTLGGGWPLGRIVNLVGDRSTGKTLLAIEACANFARQYPKGRIYYKEAEAAFDRRYAALLGLPVDMVTFLPRKENTVQEFYSQLSDVLRKQRKQPALFIVDSLDALSDTAEKKRDIDQGSYGAEKARKMSEIFRRITDKVESSQTLLFIISQTRDKIGVVFGSKVSRSGGKALDFYASQIVYLHEMGKIVRTVSGLKRPIGVTVKAKVAKNKVGLPYRECKFDMLFAYGVDSEGASLEWLADVGELHRVHKTLTKTRIPKYRKYLEKQPRDEFTRISKRISRAVKAVWPEVEEKFLPVRQKYQ